MSRVGAALALLLALGGVFAGAVPAQAAAPVRTIEIQMDGAQTVVKPATLTVAVGDRVRFHNADPTFVHSVESDPATKDWSFNCQTIAPDAYCDVPSALTKTGTYLYRGSNLDTGRFSGKVVVSATASPAPAASPTKAGSPPAPRQSAAPPPSAAPAGASPVASPTGGSGAVVAPPLAGFGGGGAPSPGTSGPAPELAPVLPGSGEAAAPGSAAGGPSVAVSPGRLAEPSTARRYGLPAALAAVAAAGVASLLVRLLLAHPAAGPRRRPGPVVTID